MKRHLPHYQNYVRKCWQTLLCCALILLAGGKAQAQCNVNAAWTYTIHGDTVFIHSTDTSSANHHYWSFNGVINTSNQISLIHIYPNYGTYQICQYVYTPGSACTDTLCQSVTLQATTPPCNISAAWSSITHGDTVYFTATDTASATHHFWNFGDGSAIATGSRATHVYAAAGTYHVCFYDYIPNTTCTDSLCQNVSVTANPCHVSAAWTYTVHGDTVRLQSADTSTVTHHYWSVNGVMSNLTTITLVQIFPNYGTYHICQYVEIPGAGCSDSSCQNITLTAPCTLNASWTYNNQHGDTIRFTSADTSSTIHRYWTFGDGSATTSAVSPTHIYATPGTYHVCVRAYSSNNTTCVDSFCSTIVVNAACRLTAAWTQTIHGDTVSFIGVDTTSAAHHIWSYGDGTTGSGFDATHVYANPGTYHVCFYVYVPGTACSDSFCNNITIGAGCHLSAAWTYTTHGDTVFLHATDTSTVNHHYWSFGAGVNGTSGIVVTHVFPGPGTYHICQYVYTTTAGGCTDSSCNNIIIANTCNVSAVWQSYMRGDTAHFYASGITSGVYYNWTFGDGTTGTGSSPLHVYTLPGTYRVCLRAYTSSICMDSFCNTVTVASGCNVTAAWSYTTHGDTVFLHSVDTLSANHHFWNVGSSSPNYLSGTNVSYVFPGPGTYHICLLVYTPGTTCLDSSCNNITVTAGCINNAAWTSHDHGDTIFFHATDTTHTTVHYDWNFGDGVYGFGINPSHVYAQAGTYHVCLYAYIPGSPCIDSFCNTVTVGNGCHVSAAWTYTTHGDSIFLHSVDTLSTNHHYWVLNGSTSTAISGTSGTFVVAGPGTYHICLYAYTPGTTCIDSSCNNITIQNTCNVNAAWQSYISGDTARFYARGDSGVYYVWHLGDGTTATHSPLTHVYAQPGTYHVCLYAYASTNAGTSCVDSFCNNITIAGCHVSAAWTYTTHGDTVFLHSTDTLSANHHFWTFAGNPNAVSGTSVTHVYTGPGTYHICLFVYTPGTTCSDSSCNNITITNPCRANAAWQSSVHGDTARFYAISTDTTVHYDWNFGDGNFGFGRVPVHVYAQAGTYHVCLYAYTGSNCIDSFCNNVTIVGCNISAAWTYTTHGDTVFLTSADTSSVNHHFWTFAGSTTAVSGTTATHVYSGPGTYHICLIVYTPGTPCSDSSCNNVVVAGNCTITAAWQSYNRGDSVHFYASSNGTNGTYTWNFGDGTTGTGIYPIHVYANPGTYHVCLYTAITGTTCVDSFCNNITVTNGCHVSAAWTYTTHGDSIFLHSVDTLSANHHYWVLNGNTSTAISGTTATFVVTGPGTYHICLYAYTPGTTCSDSSCNNVTIVNPCNVSAAWQSTTSGDTARFYARGDSGVYYVWHLGDGTTATHSPLTHVYAQPGTYHVCLYAYAGSNCVDSFCNNITIAGCNVSAGWTYTTHGDTVFLHSNDTLSANHHYWTFGSPAVVVSGTSVTHVYTGPGTYQVCLHVYTPGTTCVDSSCNTITITIPCTANAVWQSYVRGDTAHFYAISTDTTVHYDWNFGDGNYGFGRIPTHVYAQAGTYHVCLYAYTGSNCIDSFCNTITIGTGCHVTAAWTYTTSGDTVYLHSVDTLSANHHYWIFNGNTSTYASGTNVIHIFPGTGVYHICLYVYTPGTTCSDSSCNNVTVTSSCTANAAWTSHDHGDTAFFAATDTSSALYLDWNFGDGSYGYGQYPTHVYAQPGTYHVCLYAYTSNTCVDSFCNTVTVGGGCHLSAAWTYTLHGDTINLTSADTSSANHHYWVFNGSTPNYLSGTSVTHIFPGPGTYHICLYVYTPGTNCSDSSCNTITITNPCNLTAAWQSYTTGDTTHFYSATNAAGAYYNWNFGDGSSGTGPNPTHVYYHSGTYHVCLYVYTNTYCIDSFCNTVTIGSGCHITAAWTYVAYGDSLHFTGADTNSTAHHYWSFGDGHTASGFDASHVYNAPGTYHVCYYVYIPGSSCIDSSCNTVVVSGTCGVTAALSYVNISHDTVAFYALFADSNASVIWLYGDGTSSSGSYSLHGYPVPGNYQVCLHVFIPGTPCMDSACIEINVGTSCAVTAAWASITRANDSIQFYAADPDTNAVHRWIFGDGATASGSYAAHTFPTAGTYHVCLYVSVPNTTCSDSVCKDVSSALGIDGIGGNYPTISLRPNPFSQYTILNIDGPASTYEVRIYDMLGQVVRTEIAVKNSIMIQRGNLSSGIYTYAVMAGNVLIGQGKMSIE